MADHRRSQRLAAKKKKTPKSMEATELQWPSPDSPLMRLNLDSLFMIIDLLEKGSLTWEFYESHVYHVYQTRYQIRDLRNLSLVNKQLREILTPRLFKYAKMTDFVRSLCSVTSGESTQRPPLFKTLKAMIKKPLILRAIQYLILETTTSPTTYHHNTPYALWKCLELMPNLKEISLRLRGTAKLIPLLESHLEHNRKLPVLNTVHSISIYGSRSWQLNNFLELTPNIKKASIDVTGCTEHCPQLLALSKLPQLEYLMLRRVVPRPRRSEPSDPEPLGWRIVDVLAIAKIVPNIKHLALVGQLEDSEETMISEYITAFTEFTQLEQLDMTDEFTIDQDTVDDLRDDYVDSDSESEPNDEKIARRLAKASYLNELPRKVAHKFFDACPTLNKVYLTRAEAGGLFERGEEGSELKLTQAMDMHTHEHPFWFPRVLEVNDGPRPPEWCY